MRPLGLRSVVAYHLSSLALRAVLFLIDQTGQHRFAERTVPLCLQYSQTVPDPFRDSHRGCVPVVVLVEGPVKSRSFLGLRLLCDMIIAIDLSIWGMQI